MAQQPTPKMRCLEDILPALLLDLGDVHELQFLEDYLPLLGLLTCLCKLFEGISNDEGQLPIRTEIDNYNLERQAWDNRE